MKNSNITPLTAILGALALPLVTGSVAAEVTQDCILEGKVDKRKAARLGEPVYVRFRTAESGDQGPCDMTRRRDSRRIQFKAPESDDIADAPHGARVRYRYIERGNERGQWQRLEADNGRF